MFVDFDEVNTTDLGEDSETVIRYIRSCKTLKQLDMAKQVMLKYCDKYPKPHYTTGLISIFNAKYILLDHFEK